MFAFLPRIRQAAERFGIARCKLFHAPRSKSIDIIMRSQDFLGNVAVQNSSDRTSCAKSDPYNIWENLLLGRRCSESIEQPITFPESP